MPKLIQKSGYIHAGCAGGYMKYIATREGVKKLESDGPVTTAQKQLIKNLLTDFSDSKELFEYQDYLDAPCAKSASAFISTALDTNLHQIESGSRYMRYIAERPRVEKHGTHGLFSSSPSVNLDQTISDLEQHTGPVWTIIYSLRREDAARLGYDNANAWRNLLMQHEPELASAMKIPEKDFHWYAAFHDEGHHPHIHMMIWSEDPREGFLSKEGISLMRSKLTNTIFKDELLHIYEEKDIAYKELRESARSAMRELIVKMESGIYESPFIEQHMQELVGQLSSVSGKKLYGYLRKPLKQLVDEIVDEIEKQPEVSACYQVWNELRDQLESYYHEQNPRQHLPLSKQKEFRAIKNMVIREAERIRLGEHSFEDSPTEDEPDPEPTEASSQSVYEQTYRYCCAKEILENPEITAEEKQASALELERLWKEGYSVAAHQLGKFYRDALGTQQDLTRAEEWFRRSADCGNDFSEYALGKLLESENRTDEALGWLEKAAGHGNQFALYRLGKLHLSGGAVPKNSKKAIEYLHLAADMGNQYAQYLLGKLFLLGREVPQDKKQAQKWLTSAASQGNKYAGFLLERINQSRDPSVLLAATRLLHHMAKIFREQSAPPRDPGVTHIESKRRKRLLEKRLAMGHKADDHEQQSQIKLTL